MANSRSINNAVYNVVTLGCVYVIGVAFFMDTIFIETSWLIYCILTRHKDSRHVQVNGITIYML